MPGSDIAIFLNKLLTLWPALADVSMNMIPICVDFAVASSNVTCLLKLGQKRYFRSIVETSYRLSDKSALLPTSTIMTSFPRSDRTSSIHFVVDKKDWRSNCIEM